MPSSEGVFAYGIKLYGEFSNPPSTVHDPGKR